MTKSRLKTAIRAALIVVVGVAAALFFIMRSEALPSGPVDVVWDHTQCAECRMSVSERAYAAQLQTIDGQVLNFDDPGCLFQYERDTRVAVHAVYYQHVREERWLPEAEAAFIEAGPSPMGYDLGAVAAGTAGAFDPAEARMRSLPAPAGGGGETAHAY